MRSTYAFNLICSSPNFEVLNRNNSAIWFDWLNPHGKFQAFAELFVEFLVVTLLLGNFCKHLKALLHKILLDDKQNLFC